MKGIEEITEKLEEGVKDFFNGDRYKEYLDVMGRFYNYSANNCLLIGMQMPTATYVASYKKWQKDFARQVKQGEKAIRIIAPVPRKSVYEKKHDDGSIEEKEVHWMAFRAVPVFDVSQTEGKELPDIVERLTGDIEEYDALIEKLKGIAPASVTFEDIKGGALGYYSSADNKIVIKTNLDQKQTVKTLLHEIAHSMMHGENGEAKETAKNGREVQAESVAYIVCKSIGIDTEDYSFGYIAGWSSGRDVKELMESMEVIRKTAKEIIDKIK